MGDYLIKDKAILSEYIESDRRANLGDKPVSLEMRFRRSLPYLVWRYLVLLRRLELVCYRRDSAKNRFVSLICAQRVKLFDRRKNKLGMKLGIEIPVCRADKGIRIAHQNVVLNGDVGEGCVFHGNNILGNKRTGARDSTPRLGKNVDVGAGAVVIGNVTIADDCVIGAGAVVTRSFLEPGTVIAGVPAREIQGKGT